MSKILVLSLRHFKIMPELVKIERNSDLKKIFQKIDAYTSPRETTAGNFEKFSHFQAVMHSAPAGYAFFGSLGIASASFSALLGGYVKEKTGSEVLGMLAGTTVGAVSGGLLGSFGGPSGIFAGAINGGLLGALVVFRGNDRASVRDTAGNSVMISGLFIPGTGKIAGGIAAALGDIFGKSKLAKAIIGGGIAAITGGILAISGFSPAGMPVAVLGTAIAGALGPYIGPRYSQLFRNLSQDIGNCFYSFLKKHKIVKKELREEEINSLGAGPSSFLKEGIKSFIYSDGSPLAVVFSAISETIEQIHIFLTSKREKSSAG